jgi:hypothetical protein
LYVLSSTLACGIAVEVKAGGGTVERLPGCTGRISGR